MKAILSVFLGRLWLVGEPPRRPWGPLVAQSGHWLSRSRYLLFDS